MKKFIRSSAEPVKGAESTGSDALESAINDLEEDFAYIVAGLEKLGRSGPNAVNDALAVAENIKNSLEEYTSSIASKIE